MPQDLFSVQYEGFHVSSHSQRRFSKMGKEDFFEKGVETMLITGER